MLMTIDWKRVLLVVSCNLRIVELILVSLKEYFNILFGRGCGLGACYVKK